MADERMPHRLSLNERRQLTMTVVTEVVSFDDTAEVLQTSLGTLIVQGKELQLKTLSLEGGQVEVDGKCYRAGLRGTQAGRRMEAPSVRMTAPALAAHRFLCCCLLGAALGVYYEFLRPLRPRHTFAADVLFLSGGAWVWLLMSFRVCRGDLRLGYSVGLLAGGIAWDLVFGGLIAPVFSGFWKFVRSLLGFALIPAKKFSKFAKILFASAEKWVTIRWNHRREKRRKRRGEPIGQNAGGK
jgi:YabP family.